MQGDVILVLPHRYSTTLTENYYLFSIFVLFLCKKYSMREQNQAFNEKRILETFQHYTNNLTLGEKQVRFTQANDFYDVKFYLKTLQKSYPRTSL